MLHPLRCVGRLCAAKNAAGTLHFGPLEKRRHWSDSPRILNFKLFLCLATLSTLKLLALKISLNGKIGANEYFPGFIGLEVVWQRRPSTKARQAAWPQESAMAPKAEHQPSLKAFSTVLPGLKVARAWRETMPVCSGLTWLVRAGYLRHDSGASREHARITRRAQDGSVHMQRSLPSSSYPARSTLIFTLFLWQAYRL